MSTYQQQLAKCKDTDDENSYSSIWRNSVWTITDYEELFEDIDRGYIIQDPEDVFFIINPDWEGEDSDDEDSDDEEYVEHLVYSDDGNNINIVFMKCPKRITEEVEIREWIEKNESCSIKHIKINPKPTDLTMCDDCNKTATIKTDEGGYYCSVECMDIDEEEEKKKEEEPITLWDSLLEQQQKEILHSQSVWKIYFGAVLQDIREPNWREEEKEKKNCIECNVVITKDNIYEPNDCYDEPDDLCDKCGDDYHECRVCNEWCCNEALYFDEDNECKICDTCGNIEFEEIDENVEKINEFVENYKSGEYIGREQSDTTDIDAIMKLVSKLL